jgi:hypothetical protein
VAACRPVVALSPLERPHGDTDSRGGAEDKQKGDSERDETEEGASANAGS